MTLDEIRNLKTDELEKKIIEWKKELMKLRVSANKRKTAEKPHMFKMIKKTIARAHTVKRALQQGDNS
jgi:ribosomal protein L29